MLFDEEILFTYIGYAAGLATILTFAIQTLRILQTRNVTNLSSYMYIIYSLSLICWFAYGVYIESWILVISNLITFIFTFIILGLIIYYDAEDKIERERRDEETYLFNRKYFEEVVPEKIGQSVLANQKFAIMMLSFENYEKINETLGKKSRVKTLKTLSKYLEQALRDSDFIARFDENKFAIFLANSDEKTAKIVTTRLLNDIEKLSLKIGNNEVKYEIAVGICGSEHGKDLADFVNKSSQSLSAIDKKSHIKFYSEKKSK